MPRSALARACLAVVALSPACATLHPVGGAAPAAPVAPAGAPLTAAPIAPPTATSATGLAISRLAEVLELPFAVELIARMIRVEREARDAVRHVGDQLTAVVDQASRAAPDLTVLSTEPVARTESSGFGWRDDPIRHTRSFHSGTDFRGKPGAPVLAAGDGVVKFCGRLGGYGNVIDVDHGGGVITRYAHLRRIETKKDAAVTAGAEIGQVGSTGRTTGPHLHFEVRIDGAPVSPLAALTVAALQRQSPWLGRIAAMTLSPEVQASAQSAVDPPRQRAKAGQRPERPGQGRRKQVLW